MSYSVPGFKIAIPQRSSLVCWATVYAMMRSWKDQKSYEPALALSDVDDGEYYVRLYNRNSDLLTTEFRKFISDAKMKLEPIRNWTVASWETLLRRYGLLWVGTLALVTDDVLHSRIIEGISGDGAPEHTTLAIIDPAGGRRYKESFATFVKKYEGAYRSAQDNLYYQIRHF
jgi:hypothetical protein